MRNFAAIYSKEMRSYFVSPVAYVIAGVFLFLSGYLFRNILMQFNLWCLQFGQRAQQMGGQMPVLNLNEMVVTQFFAVMDFIWLLVIPMLTMRLFAEEKKNGTIELLMTSPIRTVEVMLGKFFACFSLYSIIVGLTLVYFVILEAYGSPDWGPIFTGYMGYLFLGATFISAKILHYLSFIEHLEDFQRGVIDSKDVIFYLSFTFFCLFLTTRVIESRTWRR